MAGENTDDIEVKLPDTGDIEVVLDDDTPASATSAAVEPTPVAEPPKQEVRRPKEESRTEARIPDDDGIESLKAQLAAEQKRVEDFKRREQESARRIAEANRHREEAERRAREEAQKRAKAETESADNRLDLVRSAIEAISERADAAERELARAMEQQDYAAAAKAQRALSNAETRLVQLESHKVELESANKRQLTEGRVTEPEVTSPRSQYSDQVEETASRLSPASAAWVRSHPECVTDPVLNSELVAAHNRAVRNGIPVDSDSYFSFIEERLGLGEPRSAPTPTRTAPAREAPAPAQPASPARRPSVAAPVSRESVSNSGSVTSPRTITLTPQEREFCDLSDGDNPNRYKEYALNKLALAKAGKLSNSGLN